MAKIGHILLAAALVLSLFCATAAARGRVDAGSTAQRDTLPGIISSLNDTTSTDGGFFSDNIKRLIYTSLYVNPKSDSIAQPVVDEAKLYAPYRGKIIDSIKIERSNIFQGDRIFWERWANRLHSVTSERAVSRDLLFREGDKVDADQIVRNLYLLRNRNYIGSAGVDIQTRESDSNRVGLTVKTYDNWTIGLDAKIAYDKSSNITLYDENIFGSGNKLSVITYFNLAKSRYGGNLFTLEWPNLFGTFLGSVVRVGKSFDYSYLNLDISREFINPTDYGGGILLSKQAVPYDMLKFEDSTFRVTSSGYDVWLGRSRKVGLNQSIYVTGRYFSWDYDTRPEVSAVLNPAFHNTRGFLSSVGLYREKYFTLNRVYGYGIREFLPAGFKAEAVVGYAGGEFWDSWYVGGEYKAGRFMGRGHYLMGAISVGGRISTGDGKWQQGAFNAKALWFSPMLRLSATTIRQFVTLSYTRGWSRFEGNNEMVRFTSDAQPRGFTEYVTGLNRAVANIETAIFTPWSPSGFKTVLFSYADVGFIGDNSNVFTDDFFMTVGIGARFKNEHLIFKALQMRLGLAFGGRGYIKSNIFNLSSRQSMDKMTYRPLKPEYVSYR